MWTKISKIASKTLKDKDQRVAPPSGWQVSKSNICSLSRVSRNIQCQDQWIEISKVQDCKPDENIRMRNIFMLVHRVLAKVGRLFPEAICITANNTIMGK